MKALFITLKELKRKSIIDGNLDQDKLIQFVEVAQDTYIQTQLGTKLYDQLQYEVINSSVTTVNQTLIDTYIKPMLIWYSQVAIIPFIAYQIRQGGIFKHTSESAETVSRNEVDFLVEKARTNAEWYKRRFQSYMDFNQSNFPEFYNNTNDEISPSSEETFNGWVL